MSSASAPSLCSSASRARPCSWRRPETTTRAPARPKAMITVINPVLENALSPELVMDFRSAFFERRKRLAQALAAALPGAHAEEIFPLTLHIFTQVAGLWPLCHSSSDSEELW